MGQTLENLGSGKSSAFSYLSRFLGESVVRSNVDDPTSIESSEANVRSHPKAGKSKRGELSIFPKTFIVLSHCLHMMPRPKIGPGSDNVKVTNAWVPGCGRNHEAYTLKDQACFLTASAGSDDHVKTSVLHGCIFQFGYESHKYFIGSLIDAYAKC